MAQSFQDWELIIWDDGSTDHSWAVACDFAGRDPRIVAKRSEINSGHAMALRNAINAAQGVWLAQIDSDDRLHPHTLTQVAALTNLDQVGTIYTDRLLINAMGEPIELQRSPSSEDCLNHDLAGFVPFHFTAWRRSVFNQTIGVDLKLKSAVGFDLNLKMLEKAPAIHLPRPLYDHRVHSDRLSADIDTQTMQALRAVRKAIDRRGLSLTADLKWQVTRNGHP